jgi:hypothetical protein
VPGRRAEAGKSRHAGWSSSSSQGVCWRPCLQDAERLSQLRSQASFDEDTLDQDMDDIFQVGPLTSPAWQSASSLQLAQQEACPTLPSLPCLSLVGGTILWHLPASTATTTIP